MKSIENQDDEFSQFLDFITYLCTELSSGSSPEYALARSAQYYGSQSPKALTDALEAIVEGTQSFSSAWRNVTETYQDSKIHRIVELLGRFIEKGAKTGGNRMLKVLEQIRRNLELSKNRRNIVKAQRIKVLALSLVSSAVLGMIAGITPILAIALSGSSLFNLFRNLPITLTAHVIITLFLSSIVSSYRLTQAVGNSPRTIVLCAFAFIITLVFTQNLLSSLS